MSNIVLDIENVSKQYRLGEVGTGTLSNDLKRWWFSVRGKEDPFLKIGETNDRTQKGESDYVWALRDINFQVEQGQAVGIIGRNGAGKSTLLKLLSRVTKPTTGTIKYKGRIASLLEVGTGFHPEMTGRENIYLNGAILGMTRSEISRKFDEIVDFAGVERYIDTPVKRYSSGMYVRLAFAVAAHLESEILIVDEVLAVGDSEFQKKCLGKMGDVSKGEGRTILFVSHNMASVQNLCESSVLMNNGKIDFIGNSEDAIQKYLNRNFSVSDFKNLPDRRGKGPVRISDIKIYGEAENKQPFMGNKLVIEASLENPLEIPAKDIVLDINIEDNRGNKLMWLSTYLNPNLEDNPLHKITFIINSIMLNHGTYILSFDMSVNKVLSDAIEQAIIFEVAETDFFKNGKKIPDNKSKVLNHLIISYD